MAYQQRGLIGRVALELIAGATAGAAYVNGCLYNASNTPLSPFSSNVSDYVSDQINYPILGAAATVALVELVRMIGKSSPTSEESSDSNDSIRTL